jgi:hypothetical protein
MAIPTELTMPKIEPTKITETTRDNALRRPLKPSVTSSTDS